MTAELDVQLLGRLETALAVDVSPSERELADLRTLVAGPSGAALVFPRLRPPQRRRRSTARAVAALAVAAAAALLVVTQIGRTRDPAPNAVAAAKPPVDAAPGTVALEMSVLRDALARRDRAAVTFARDKLLLALGAMPPSARAQVQFEAESLLVEAEAFLAGTAKHPVAETPTPEAPAAPSEVLDRPSDGTTPEDAVAPTPTTTPRHDDGEEPGDD